MYELITDVMLPTISGCGSETGGPYFAMDQLKIIDPTFDDNFAVRYVRKNNTIDRKDVLTEDVTITYTVEDFAGNTNTCTRHFTVHCEYIVLTYYLNEETLKLVKKMLKSGTNYLLNCLLSKCNSFWN